MEDVPEEVLLVIFHFVPADSLLLSCPLVCKFWHKNICGENSKYYWNQRHKSQGLERFLNRNPELTSNGTKFWSEKSLHFLK